MSRYINANGTLAFLGRGEGLKVVITNVSTGVAIQAGALANEEQTEAEYMAMHGFEPLGEHPPADYPTMTDCVEKFAVSTPSFDTASGNFGKVMQLNVDGKIAGTGGKKHWSVELAEAMEEMVRATDAHTKSAARLAKAAAALTRAQSNAENSILGTDA